MESLGWLQGSIVKRENVAQLLELAGKSNLVNDDRIMLIVASGSCDVANQADPIVEFSIARSIERIDGSFRYNKNPRRLHCNLESAVLSKVCLDLNAYEKIAISKELLPKGIGPNTEICFSQNELSFYVDWLAARYKRPAFPTEFDRRIDLAWKKEKRRKAVAKLSDKLIGIYVKVYPDSEITQSENYAVDLLGLIIPDLSEDDFKTIQIVIDQYKQALSDAKMDVGEVKILTEFQVSVGTLKQYKRFNLDELSYKNEDPLPPELNMI
uniref:hypothetical protein n=1 Tax=uncultured Acinetobacter sp. TaxID=165433 RepID=UPI002635FB69|nr:hypothetical protein [uncultured Acinetobacter sp.]